MISNAASVALTVISLPENGGDLRHQLPKRFVLEGETDSSIIAIRCDNHMDRLAGVDAASAGELFGEDGDRFISADDFAGARHKLLSGVECLGRGEQEPVKLISWISDGRVFHQHAHLILSTLYKWHQRFRQSRDHGESPVAGETN